MTMDNTDYNWESSQTASGLSKTPKSKRKGKKKRVELEDNPDNGVDMLDNGYAPVKRQNHYSNHGFVDDDYDSVENNELQTRQPKKEKKRKTRVVTDQTESTSETPSSYGSKSRGKITEIDDSPNEVAVNLEEKPKRRKKKREPKILDADIDNDEYNSGNENRKLPSPEEILERPEVTKLKKKKPRKKRENNEFTHTELPTDHSGPDLTDQFDDTGYGSFNKKEKRQHKTKKKKEILDNSIRDHEAFHEFNTVTTENYEVKSHYDEEDVQVIHKKKKNRRSRLKKDVELNEQTECSPSVQAKIIHVHGKSKSHSSDILDPEIEYNEKQAGLSVNTDLKQRKKAIVKKTSAKQDDYLVIDDFDDELEEIERMLLPNRKSSINVTKAIPKTFYKSNSPCERKESITGEIDDILNSYENTEVVPFSNNSWDSDIEINVEVDGSHKSKSDSKTSKKKFDSSEYSNGASQKPLKKYAFGDNSNTNSNESSQEENEDEPVKLKPGKSHGSPVKTSAKPPKAVKQSLVNTPPAPIIVESTNFEKDVQNNDTLEKENTKPPRHRKSLFEMPRSESPNSSGSEPGELKGIFTIDGSSYDVVQKDDCITWTCMSKSHKVPRSRKKSFVRSSSGGSFRGSTSSLATAEVEEMNTLYYLDILGVAIKKEKRSKAKHAEGVCIGIQIYTYDKKEENRLKEREILLQHPSELECTKWVNVIKDKLEECIERPRSVKVFLQPYAGITRSGQYTYNHKIKPLFEVAGLTVDAVTVNHNEHIKQEMAHIDLEAFDCIVIVGGDGTVNRVITGLMNKQQEISGVEKRHHFTPAKLRCSIGIIPTGSSNQIVHSIQGIEDPVTSAIHIILGNSCTTDLCSVFEEDKFFSWSFNSHYGFFGNILTYMMRYVLFADNKVDAAVMKALTKSKFRSYECEVAYIPAPDANNSHPQDGHVCYTGCRRCPQEIGDDISDNSVSNDDVQPLDQLDESIDQHGVLEIKDKSQWKTIKGNFHNVSIFSLPGNSNLCPRGMSMCTHINDGCLDLALVENIDRKQFVRYLRRHGKTKDQFDFPFIHTYRCKQIRFQLRLKETWKHDNHNYDEIDYETKKSEEKQSEKSVEVIDDLGDESDEAENADRKIMSFLGPDDDSDYDSYDEENDKKKPGKNDSKKKNKEKEKNSKKEKKDKEKTNKTDASDSKDGKKVKSSFWSRLGKKKKESKTAESEEENEESEVKDFSDTEADDEKHKLYPPSSQAAGEFLHDLSMSSSEESEESDENEDDEKTGYKMKKGGDSKKKGLKGLFHVTPGPQSGGATASRYYSRPDYAQQNLQYTKKQERKKKEKIREKADKRMKANWNIDNEVYQTMNLLFRVHQGLIRIHGNGIAPTTDPDEVTMKCLGVF